MHKEPPQEEKQLNRMENPKTLQNKIVQIYIFSFCLGADQPAVCLITLTRGSVLQEGEGSRQG